VSSPRIGLFGGTFDPPHDAHVALARAALDALRLDELRWIPAGQPWQKTRAVSAGVHREAMVRAAIEGEPRFVLDRIELERSGPSYTLDTVRALRARHPQAQLFLVIGADQYASLHTWHGWQELLGAVTLAVANRPGATAPIDQQVLRFPHRAVPLPMQDISATDIRARVAKGLPIEQLVPAAVAGYIESMRLYKDSSKD
jgi:nicotinate-nucleotide adenylyltransferase